MTKEKTDWRELLKLLLFFIIMISIVALFFFILLYTASKIDNYENAKLDAFCEDNGFESYFETKRQGKIIGCIDENGEIKYIEKATSIVPGENPLDFSVESNTTHCKFKFGDVVREDSQFGNRFDSGIITQVYPRPHSQDCFYEIQVMGTFLLEDNQLTNHTMYPHHLDIDEQNPTWSKGDWTIFKEKTK